MSQGPWLTQGELVDITGSMNTGYSEQAWASAQQASQFVYPKWPQSFKSARIQSELDKDVQVPSQMYGEFQHPFVGSQCDTKASNYSLGAPQLPDTPHSSRVMIHGSLETSTACGCNGETSGEPRYSRDLSLEASCSLKGHYFKLTDIPKCTLDSWKTTIHDLTHFKEIPADSFWSKLGLIISQNDRGVYLAGSIFIIVMLIHVLKHKHKTV